MPNEPNYLEIWGTILLAIHARISDTKQEYGIDAKAIEVIEQPARTIVIRAAGRLAQASISLRGDSIEIKRHGIADGNLDDEPEVIEIEVKNGVVAYIHDDIDRTTDPNKVAEIILSPIFDYYRAA